MIYLLLNKVHKLQKTEHKLIKNNIQICSIFVEKINIMSALVILKNENCQVVIEKGELISFQKDTKEYIHQKGSKGWGNSDIEMFPVIGPISKNNFRVHTEKGDAIQDQHGFLRELEYTLTASSDTTAKLVKK